MNNPFELTFGLKPNNYIARLKQSSEIIDSFEQNTSRVYMITGVRGTGKTVMLSHISDHFSDKKDWIVVEIISESDMLDQLASRLYDRSLLHKIFDGKTFGFSFNGLSFSIKGEKPVTNVISLIEILLEKINKANKKVLICVDEAVNNQFMRPFVQTIQLLFRKKMPIYLLITGLYQNIFELQNKESLTFLYRAPKLSLEPLDLSDISSSYETELKVDEKEAIELAKLTKGYAFAYQLLGFLMFKQDKKVINKKLLDQYDSYLRDYVYDKIWSELSVNDKKVLKSFKADTTESVEALLNGTKMEKKSFSVYRDRLIKRGLIYSPSYGRLSIKLPRFFEYIQNKIVFGE